MVLYYKQFLHFSILVTSSQENLIKNIFIDKIQKSQKKLDNFILKTKLKKSGC